MRGFSVQTAGLLLVRWGFLEAVKLGFLNWVGSTSNGFCEGESLCGGPIGHKLYSCSCSHTYLTVRTETLSDTSYSEERIYNKHTCSRTHIPVYRGSLSSSIVGDVWDSDPAQCLSIAPIHLV